MGLCVPTRLRAEAVLSRWLSRVKLITGGVTAQQTAATAADPLHTQQHTHPKRAVFFDRGHYTDLYIKHASAMMNLKPKDNVVNSWLVSHGVCCHKE